MGYAPTGLDAFGGIFRRAMPYANVCRPFRAKDQKPGMAGMARRGPKGQIPAL